MELFLADVVRQRATHIDKCAITRKVPHFLIILANDSVPGHRKLQREMIHIVAPYVAQRALETMVTAADFDRGPSAYVARVNPA
jgi:hypothetical protein